jgi:hypothetical protein
MRWANLEGRPNWQSSNTDGVLLALPHEGQGKQGTMTVNSLLEHTKLGGAAVLDVRREIWFNSPCHVGPSSLTTTPRHFAFAHPTPDNAWKVAPVTLALYSKLLVPISVIRRIDVPIGRSDFETGYTNMAR